MFTLGYNMASIEASTVWDVGTWTDRWWVNGNKMLWKSALPAWIWSLYVVINVALVAVFRINWVDHAGDMSRDKPSMGGDVIWCWSWQKQRWWWLFLVITSMNKVLGSSYIWNMTSVLLQATIICEVMVLRQISKVSPVSRNALSIVKKLLIAGFWLASLKWGGFAKGLWCCYRTACLGKSVVTVLSARKKTLSILRYTLTYWVSTLRFS